MANEPVDTASKERRHQAYHTTLLPHHNVSPDLITDIPFCFNYGPVLPINHHYVQKIVEATSPQSINVGGVVQNLQPISVAQDYQY